MIKKIGKFIWRMFLIVWLLCIIIYLWVAYFYKDTFMVNIWINGIYCTGKTVDEVNTELLRDAKAPFLTIIDSNGETAEINMADASYSEDYTESLQNYIRNQNIVLWPLYLLEEKHIELLPAVSWDEKALTQLIYELDMVRAAAPEPFEVTIVLGKEGYELHDNLYNVFSPELFADYVLTNVKNGIFTASFAESGAYAEQSALEEQAETRALWKKLEEFISCGIVYDMGDEKIPLDKSITSTFVKTDESGAFILNEEGAFVLDEEAVEAFIMQLAEEYNTCDTELAFAATRGETVNVPYVTYGTELDTKAEIAYLKEAFLNKVEEVHIPKYIQEGYVRGKNDIGDTYIEIDMTNQKLYCYKAGELLLETDIVTGNMKRKWGTPEGVNFVYAKQTDRILRGEGYASPVDYWMPVKGGIGIHDADWRKSFGGEIYKTNGSHGCINVPPKIMPTIYEEYEVGTPVIMFY